MHGKNTTGSFGGRSFIGWDIRFSLMRNLRWQGGLVCFPMGGKIWEINERGLSEERLLRLPGLARCRDMIDFSDYPTLSGYNLPNWSHLDPEVTVKFTKA